MRVILIGYGEMFRALASGILKSKHELVGVMSNENLKGNCLTRFFSHYINPSPDIIFIKTHSIPVIKAKSVNSDDFRRILKKLKVDVVIVGSWSEKFSMQTINVIPNGFVNVHPSLLPKYRGPNPYIHVILNNEQMTGITFHLMDVNYDTGAILHQRKVPVLSNDTGASLKHRCCEQAKSEIIFLLDNFKDRVLYQKSQNEKESTYQSRVSLKELIINFENETSEQIVRRIRAFTPWANCYIPIKGEFFSFKKFEIIKEDLTKTPSIITNKTKNSVSVVCKDLKIIKFTNLRVNRPFSKYISFFFINRLIKINDKAV